MSEQDRQRPWWGTHEIGVDDASRWEIGGLRFWLQRRRSEWWLAHAWFEIDEPAEWGFVRSSPWPEDETAAERFAVSETTGIVHLRPLPSTRSVVARPRTPLRVLPGQRARVFVSSPLSVEIAVGATPTVLRDLPTRRLSDTWFGATTREGELSYALRTSARTRLDEMPRGHYRLLTPIVIENLAADALVVERLNLPVPFLSIYSDEIAGAWSEEVRLLRTADGDMAELDVHDGPPAEAAGAKRLSEPRKVAEKGHLFRAFGTLLGFD
jgi:hypothetical protein